MNIIIYMVHKRNNSWGVLKLNQKGKNNINNILSLKGNKDSLKVSGRKDVNLTENVKVNRINP